MIFLGLVVLTSSSTAQAGSLAPGDHERSFVYDGLERSYDLQVPESYDGTPLPLVIDIHGFGSAPWQQKAISGYRLIAQEEGFLVAHPAGISASWNGGICCGVAASTNLDDVGFLKTLAGDIADAVAVDASRIYATGLSNGGAMSHRLGCEAEDFFAAIAPAAFPVPFNPRAGCAPQRPMPIHFSMGRTDTVVSYASAEPSRDHWLSVNGCGTKPDATFESGLARCDTYRECDDGVEVEFCSVVGDDFAGGPLEGFAGHILYINPDVDIAVRGWALMSKYTTDPAPVLAPEPAVPLLGVAVVATLAPLARRRRFGWVRARRCSLGDRSNRRLP